MEGTDHRGRVIPGAVNHSTLKQLNDAMLRAEAKRLIAEGPYGKYGTTRSAMGVAQDLNPEAMARHGQRVYSDIPRKPEMGEDDED